jgi:hypothetical protein
MRIVIPITLAEFRLNGSASTVKLLKRKFSMQLSSQSFQNGSPIYRLVRERPQHEGHLLWIQRPRSPWNDSLVHHYTFTLYAVDVPKLEVKGDLTGIKVREALNGHILAQAKISGTYTLTPRLETPKHYL